jgi:hypothetical protein
MAHKAGYNLEARPDSEKLLAKIATAKHARSIFIPPSYSVVYEVNHLGLAPHIDVIISRCLSGYPANDDPAIPGFRDS